MEIELTSATKRGSSRRKGDEYQDCIALKLALELYIKRINFAMHLEYIKAGNLDDIFIILPSQILAFQVKYAVDNNSLYDIEDLTSQDSKIYIKNFPIVGIK